MGPVLPEGSVFFLEWPTWARLAFVLGGLFALILLIASIIKFKNWTKVAKLEKKAAEERAERGEMTLVHVLSDDIPFGIRALMEDPEVEGIWNSRTITPLHFDQGDGSTPAQPTNRYSSTSSTSIYDTADISLASPDALTPSTDFTAVVDPPPEASSLRRKGKTLVISYNGPYLRSEATDVAPGATSATKEEKFSNSPSKMHLRSITTRPSSGSRKFVIGNRQRNTPGHQRAQVHSEVNPLEFMEAHRRFHAAESGQLIPRNCRHTDMVLTTPLAPSASDSEDSDSSTSRALSWPSRSSNINLGKQLSRQVKKMDGPSPIPFRAFVESLPTSKPPPSAWTEKTQARVDAKVPASSKASDTTSKVSMHSPTSSTSSTSNTIPTTATDSISIANTRSRKINNGFELLPAGTLEKGPKVKDLGTGHENTQESKKPKKLQKRSRSGSGSRRNSTETHRLSTESFRLPIF